MNATKQMWYKFQYPSRLLLEDAEQIKEVLEESSA